MQSWLFLALEAAEPVAKAYARARAAGARALVLRLAGGDRAACARAAEIIALARRESGPAVFIEPPSGRASGEAALAALIPARPDGVVLQRADGPAVQQLGARLAVLEAEAGLPDGGVKIVAMVQTPAAILGISAFAGASPRLLALAYDPAALGAALGACDDSAPLATARGLVSLGAAAAGVTALIVIGEQSDDIPGACAKARHDGFAAALVARPEHIEAVNSSFSANIDKRPRSEA